MDTVGGGEDVAIVDEGTATLPVWVCFVCGKEEEKKMSHSLLSPSRLFVRIQYFLSV